MADKILIDKQAFDKATDGKLDGLYDEILITRHEYEYLRSLDASFQDINSGMITGIVGADAEYNRYLLVKSHDETVQMVVQANINLQSKINELESIIVEYAMKEEKSSKKKWWKIW